MKENEEVLNHLNKNITAFLTKLLSKDLSEQDDKKIGSYYHVVSDIERVGDYAENVMEYAMRLKEEDVKMSVEAREELEQVRLMINDLYNKVFKAFDDRDVSYITEIEEIEDSIDRISVELEHRHIERVKAGSCNAQLGSVFLQTVSNLERVGDHITNVAKSLKGYSKAPKSV